MSEAMNKVKWNTFAKQAKGSDITEIHVDREDKGPQVVIKYNGKNRKGGRIVTGEWVIEKGEKDEAAIGAVIKEFLERARKDFFVRREGKLQGDAFGSKQEEEGLKAKPIVGEAPPTK
jgi:hypothetical protein